MKKFFTSKGMKIFYAAAGAFIAAYVIINLIVVLSTNGDIIEEKEVESYDFASESYDCILVLGAGILRDGSISDVLRDRLDTGIELYLAGAAPKLLMSGDHGRKNYDEVNKMKEYAISKGVPSEDIFMDHAGFSTYESVYRAKEIFCVSSAILVTQEFHLNRALYIADALGVRACGVEADRREYFGQLKYDIRESAARVKDFFFTVFKPLPTYLGDAIPISGNGNATDDRER